ncbi:hypothetical protein RI103_13540 [Paraburkholderia sp. FT54]|uniref:hypothetical protein n=1 Tax=Paraburkholderia sp. FT54 TaxID=3074437 RepID=UPI0028775226|nr:hypothetical protein [Paraburkholderia sp. FT54]WNC88726.1 hypothetical protein RI103_13540 [Paraburkholderia sp. FT54]
MHKKLHTLGAVMGQGNEKDAEALAAIDNRSLDVIRKSGQAHDALPHHLCGPLEIG